ncbi:MAG: hypothetical protein PHX61_07605 [Alphaproteobacteria bacterium]|nr:hypothetical protein [Alphaproteobacteria bacterium]
MYKFFNLLKGNKVQGRLNFVLSCLFFLLALIYFLSIIMGVTSAVEVFDLSSEELDKYPLGTELGFEYLTKESYIGSNVLWSFILFQSLTSSTLFYIYGRKAWAVLLQALPIIFSIFFRSLDL